MYCNDNVMSFVQKKQSKLRKPKRLYTLQKNKKFHIYINKTVKMKNTLHA